MVNRWSYFLEMVNGSKMIQTSFHIIYSTSQIQCFKSFPQHVRSIDVLQRTEHSQRLTICQSFSFCCRCSTRPWGEWNWPWRLKRKQKNEKNENLQFSKSGKKPGCVVIIPRIIHNWPSIIDDLKQRKKLDDMYIYIYTHHIDWWYVYIYTVYI